MYNKSTVYISLLYYAKCILLNTHNILIVHGFACVSVCLCVSNMRLPNCDPKHVSEQMGAFICAMFVAIIHSGMVQL